MQSKCITKIEINKVRIAFTEKKMTAYGGFSLLALFFERINLTDLFAVGGLPLASTTLTRLFKKIRKLKEVEEMSEGLWGYLKGLIP
ncbi:MAG TPA: hypothetical protein VFG06_01325, partial [Thermodesulfovibrionales bacterium]|nr:hypothetical protein [Thermodesulfovibrionales bacterium]